LLSLFGRRPTDSPLALALAVGACSIALLVCSATLFPLSKMFAVDDAAEKLPTERGRRQSFREE